MSPPPRRWLLPPVAVAILALVGSLALHVPAYLGLGVLKALLADEDAQRPAPPMEVEILDSRPSESDESAQADATPEPHDDDDAPPEPPPAPERTARREEREPEPEPEERREEPVAVQPVAPPPPPSEQRRATSVSQRSRDPSVPPPDDAQYLAEENNRVEEETLARITNDDVDDPTPQLAAAEEPTPENEDEGDAAEQATADLHDQEGSDERDPTQEEARLPEQRPEPEDPSRSRTPQVAQAARGDARGGANEAQARPAEAAGGGRQAQGGGEPATHEVVVHDRLGTYRIRVPNERPLGEGPGEGGGPAVAGRGRGSAGEGLASGRAGPGRRRARGGGHEGGGAPDLRLSWSRFASLYGEEELQRQRDLWVEQRRSRTRGTSHQERWDRFRAAIENYGVQVRPGNQTALNARADPFAAYIASMHRRIHHRFAEGFLTSVPPTVETTYRTNPDMHTLLEVVIDPDGRVVRIGVVVTSGDILFDYGAYNSVMASQPFEATPAAIRSPDGLVYLHWGFYRNDRQCGTFNVNPYILARPPSETGPAARSERRLLDSGSLFRPSPSERQRDDGR